VSNGTLCFIKFAASIPYQAMMVARREGRAI
jgi:hypothetical protein